MKRWLAAALVLTAGCNGSVETQAGAASSGDSASAASGGTDPCAPAHEPIDSKAAFALVHCAFPSYTKIEGMRSSPAGDLDSLGRSSQWAFVLRDEAAGMVQQVDVTPSHGAKPDGAAGASNSCAGEEVLPLDSAAVVPDAIERFAPHNPHAGEYTNYFLDQRAACAEASTGAHAGVLIYQHKAGGMPDGPPGYWEAHYDPPAKFVKLCGPCSGFWTGDCTSCFE